MTFPNLVEIVGFTVLFTLLFVILFLYIFDKYINSPMQWMKRYKYDCIHEIDVNNIAIPYDIRKYVINKLPESKIVELLLGAYIVDDDGYRVIDSFNRKTAIKLAFQRIMKCHNIEPYNVMTSIFEVLRKEHADVEVYKTALIQTYRLLHERLDISPLFLFQLYLSEYNPDDSIIEYINMFLDECNIGIRNCVTRDSRPFYIRAFSDLGYNRNTLIKYSSDKPAIKLKEWALHIAHDLPIYKKITN